MRPRHRQDGNHRPITRDLARVTEVIDVHNTSMGCDLIARNVVTGAPELLELKDPAQPPSARKLTDSERKLQAMFPRHFHVVLTFDDALVAVGMPIAVTLQSQHVTRKLPQRDQEPDGER